MNEIKFTCQTCGQHILVESKEAGRKVVCPSCKTQITIPRGPTGVPRKTGPGGRHEESRNMPASPRTPTQNRRGRDMQPAGQTRPAAGEEPSGKPRAAARPQPATEAKCKPAPAPQPGTAVALNSERASAPQPPATVAPKTEPAPALRLERKPAPRQEPPATASPSPSSGAALEASPPMQQTAELSSTPVQVGVLTPEIKREIVRAVRDLIADPARWMPGAGEDGKLAYAARQTQAGLERVQVGSDDATHYSLLGGILLEMQRRNVVTTATGRTEFLDREIPEAIRKVAAGSAHAVEQGAAADATDRRLMSVSHAQCLQALDVLEREYAVQDAARADSPALRELRGATLDELLARAARDEAISSAELVRAVHRELREFDKRLSGIEKRGGDPGSAGSS